MACFMALVSYLAANPSVLRIGPLHGVELLDDVVSAIVQSGNIVDTPIQDAGLNGKGEVIQVWGVLGAVRAFRPLSLRSPVPTCPLTVNRCTSTLLTGA